MCRAFYSFLFLRSGLLLSQGEWQINILLLLCCFCWADIMFYELEARKTKRYAKILLTSLVPQIYTPVLKGSYDKQTTGAYPVIEQAYVESTGYSIPCIRIRECISYSRPFNFAVNFKRQMGLFYSVKGGSPRSFDRQLSRPNSNSWWFTASTVYTNENERKWLIFNLFPCCNITFIMKITRKEEIGAGEGDYALTVIFCLPYFPP